MRKDAYYFPHFSNARHDKKLQRVRKELGVEGYGIYFMLLETLRDQEGFSYTADDIDLLADDFGTSEQKVRTVLCNYGLFTFTDDGQLFTSERFTEYMRPYLEKKERARMAANKRWNNSDANAYANALPEQCASNASKVKKSKVKKSKVNESKVNESKGNDTKSEVNGYPVTEATHEKLVEHHTLPTILDYYERIRDYVNSQGKKDYRDYAATARNWIKRDIAAGKITRNVHPQAREPDEVEQLIMQTLRGAK
jgi:uncharacterized protein YdaU (DUF1376 family)